MPAVTYVEECDFSHVDLKVLLPTVLRATAAALKEFPELNARLERDEIVYFDRYDLGIAVQTDDGLVVPVVRGCDTRSIDELRADVDALAEKAQDRHAHTRGAPRLDVHGDERGQALRAVRHADRQSPRGRASSACTASRRARLSCDGEVVVRPMGNISTTFDHRVVDGARAAQFTLRVIEQLQTA